MRNNRRWFAAAVLLAVLTMVMCNIAWAESATVEDAILYTVDETGISYNVVYQAQFAAGVTVADETGNGIDSLEALTAVLGKAPDLEAAACVPGDTVGGELGLAVRAALTLEDGVVTGITVTSVGERPMIGISWKKDSIGNDYLGFAEAYLRGGARVTFMTRVTTEAEAEAMLAQVDGIFMTGGEDVNPALYGEEAYPHGSSGWNDARDTSDILMIRAAIAADVPMLAVCRGEQIFNVAMGGGLIQDIPSYLGSLVASGEIDPARAQWLPDTGLRTWTADGPVTTPCLPTHYRVTVDGLVHSGGTGYHVLGDDEFLAIDESSRWFYDIAGGPNLTLVATAHHQAVNPEKLGEGLTIVAHSSDGIVEGIEYQGNLFALGIQFHPERDALRDTRSVDISQDECNRFLGALVHYAAVYASGK
ncbi:MAG: gamma-glutamyl-gamma-aminobutyrate hydrolase family protein [Aristaeellaceae bacterium]